MTPVAFLCRSLGIHGALTVTGRKRSTPAVPVFVLIYVMVVDCSIARVTLRDFFA